MVSIKELEELRGYLVDIAIKLKAKEKMTGEEKRAFSSTVDWLTKEIEKIKNE